MTRYIGSRRIKYGFASPTSMTSLRAYPLGYTSSFHGGTTVAHLLKEQHLMPINTKYGPTTFLLTLLSVTRSTCCPYTNPGTTGVCVCVCLSSCQLVRNGPAHYPGGTRRPGQVHTTSGQCVQDNEVLFLRVPAPTYVLSPSRPCYPIRNIEAAALHISPL